jgi:hypothetical protein
MQPYRSSTSGTPDSHGHFSLWRGYAAASVGRKGRSSATPYAKVIESEDSKSKPDESSQEY